MEVRRVVLGQEIAAQRPARARALPPRDRAHRIAAEPAHRPTLRHRRVDRQLFLVIPFADGETLRARTTRCRSTSHSAFAES